MNEWVLETAETDLTFYERKAAGRANVLGRLPPPFPRITAQNKDNNATCFRCCTGLRYFRVPVGCGLVVLTRALSLSLSLPGSLVRAGG